MRSVLVNADRRPGLDARLRTALALADAAGGHVTVLVDTPVARYISMDPMGGNFVASDALKEALVADDANAAAIEAQLAKQSVPFEVLRSEEDPIEALARLCRLADIAVLSKSGGLAGDLALVARTPVLALSDNDALQLPPTTACIAWDGGDEAALALRSATTLLADCQSVQLLTVTEKSGGVSTAAALRYLKSHRVNATLKELERKGSTEETLAKAVAEANADLLVMGAYGHSRVREFMFGGVTRYFLEEPTAPALLLAH